eukprot:5736473-Prymnesium_polylepis.1
MQCVCDGCSRCASARGVLSCKYQRAAGRVLDHAHAVHARRRQQVKLRVKGGGIHRRCDAQLREQLD